MSENFTAFMGDVTEVYTSTTLPTGYQPGMRRREGNKTYVFVLAKGTIADKAIYKPNTADATHPYDVIATAAAATDPVSGVNSTGAARSSGDYFWGQIGGVANVLVDATAAISAGSLLAASGTAGTAAVAPTSTAVRCVFGVALEALASGTGNKAVRLQGLDS